MTAKFLNKRYEKISHKKLMVGHEYEIYFKAPKGHHYAYSCHVIYDNTAQEEIDIWFDYSSQISIKQNWKIDKLELDND